MSSTNEGYWHPRARFEITQQDLDRGFIEIHFAGKEDMPSRTHRFDMELMKLGDTLNVPYLYVEPTKVEIPHGPRR